METGSELVVVASWAAAGVVSATAAAIAEVALKRVYSDFIIMRNNSDYRRIDAPFSAIRAVTAAN